MFSYLLEEVEGRLGPPDPEGPATGPFLFSAEGLHYTHRLLLFFLENTDTLSLCTSRHALSLFLPTSHHAHQIFFCTLFLPTWRKSKWEGVDDIATYLK